MSDLMYRFLKSQDPDIPVKTQDKKVKDQIFKSIVIPSLLDRQKGFCNKSFQFIRNCIYYEKSDAKEVINYIIEIIADKKNQEEEYPLQYIKIFIRYLRSEQ